jgi:hypothetical protein
MGIVSFTYPGDPRFRWDVSIARSKRGSFAWVNEAEEPNRGDERLLGTASLNHSAAAALFEGAPRSLEDVFAAAAASTPQAFDLASRVSIHTETSHRRVDSWNLVARLEGSDPVLRDEHVVYVAHIDHIARAEDPIPEQVLFIRSDHFSFIRQGIPALFIKSGFETGDPALDGSTINAAFRSDLYHTPFDEADQGFDFDAGVQHARVNFLTGYVVAQETARPTWNPGDFFGGLFGGR